MGIGRSFVIVLCMSLFLPACASPGGPVGNGITGQGQPVNRDTAIALAKRDSPLREVSEDQVTQFLPIRRVVIGKDEQGRQLVVWVRGGVERYVYLDQIKLTSREQVMAVAAKQGVTPEQVRHVVLDYLDRGDRPVIWEVVTADKDLWIDAITGEIVPHKVP
jgi:uncharacterized protein YpmB